MRSGNEKSRSKRAYGFQESQDGLVHHVIHDGCRCVVEGGESRVWLELHYTTGEGLMGEVSDMARSCPGLAMSKVYGSNCNYRIGQVRAFQNANGRKGAGFTASCNCKIRHTG
jgi:hypothetical protein